MGQLTLQTSASRSGKSKAAKVTQRVIIGAILLAAVVCLFWADAVLSRFAPRTQGSAWTVNWQGLVLHGGLSTLMAAAIVVAATAETLGMCRNAGMRPAGPWAVSMAFVLTIHPWMARNVQGIVTEWLAVWLLVIALVGSVAAIMARRQTEGAIQDIASTWFAAVYLGFLMSFAVRMRQEVTGPGGAWLALYFIAVVKFTDIFAYGAGMAFGRRALIPWLSPGKTVEGLIGGLVGAAIIAMLLVRASVIIGIDRVQHPIAPGVYVWAGLIGASLGGIGQIGDLMESLLKRGAKQKDSAGLLPGFGGVFDLLDSIALAAPAAWVLLPWVLAPLLR
jgi:phosphatidate cytidylyltransferase